MNDLTERIAKLRELEAKARHPQAVHYDGANWAWTSYLHNNALPIIEALVKEREELVNIVDRQAEDYGLWFEAITAPEAYLQRELRRLHSAVDALK